MELELSNIIEKLKTEGVDEAEKKAAGIISEAEAKAKNIIAAAEEQKEALLKDAGKKAQTLQKNGEEAVKNASRDALLALREQITALFDKVVKRQIAEQLSPEALKDMIVRLVETIAKEKNFDIEILLSKNDKETLEKVLFAALKGELKKSVTLKVSPNVEHGFLIGEKGGSSYYDFTDEAIAEAFNAFLNPKIAEILTS